MTGRTTPYIIGAAALMAVAIVGAYFLFQSDRNENQIAETERIQPLPEPAPLIEERVVTQQTYVEPELEKVYFDFDRANLRPDARRALDKNTQWLKQHPDDEIRLEGHCDELGSEEYNYALGQKRADAVERALIQGGISSQRIKTISYGRSQPEIPNADTDSEHQKNRRVTFEVRRD